MIAMLLLGCFMKQSSPESVPEMATTIPAVPAVTTFIPTAPVRSKLENGEDLWLVENHDLPLLVLKVILPGGYGSEQDGKWGRAQLASAMLQESSGERSALEVSSQLHMLATGVGVGAYSSSTVISVTMHRERLAEVLPIIADMIYEPAFKEEDWKRVQEQQILGVQQERKSSRSIASQFAGYYLHGPEHPLGIPSAGTTETLSTLTKEEVESWHRSRLQAEGVSFVLVGDITEELARTALVENFSSWTGEGFVGPEVPGIRSDKQGAILLVDMPESQQTMIRLVSNAYDQDSGEAEAAQLAAKIMGGSFTSRLNSSLREENGYTYGIGCWFSDTSFGSVFSVSTSVRTDVTVEALSDIYQILRAGEDGYSAEDVAKAKVLDRTDRIESVESRRSIANNVTDMVLMNQDINHQEETIAKLDAVSAEDMKDASQYLLPERGVTLLIGDASMILEPLKEAGFEVEIVELPE